jgi:hypothetical protein
MNTTPETEHPAALTDTLARFGLNHMLNGYVPRQHVTRRVSWQEFAHFVKGQGYEVMTEGGNVYGRVGVRPAVPTIPAPTLRIVTKNDVAAVYGSRRGA